MITAQSPLVLASGSPRRRAILEGLGIPIVVQVPQVEEGSAEGKSAAEYVAAVVEKKLHAAIEAAGADPRGGLLVADTVVAIDGQVLGKPRDTDHATELLARLQGRTHTVYTRYAIADERCQRAATRTVATRVSMRRANPEEIRRYAETGEGLDKAGAYAAQGIGAFLVARIDGSYSNVVGLPACEVVQDLGATGLLGPFP